MRVIIFIVGKHDSLQHPMHPLPPHVGCGEGGASVIHYHGTPLTPRAELMTMAGEHFCVSYWTPSDIDVCMQIGQSVMLDNGAFSSFTRGVPFDAEGFAEWAGELLGHPHWAVIPDVIDGTVEQQRKMREA